MCVSVRSSTYIYWAVLLFIIPLPWLFAWLFAMIFHEFAHWLSVRLCGGRVDSVVIGVGGMNMHCNELTDKKLLLCILCGPLSGFLLALLGRWLPRIAVCGWLLSMYNLLPLLPLDGGKVMQILLGNKINIHLFERIFLAFLSFVAVYFAFVFNSGALPLFVVGLLWLKNRKIPCKPGLYKVQ